MEKVERDLGSLIKDKMESDKGYMKRLHDLEMRRRRFLKGKSKSGGRELNDSGEEEISTIDSVGVKSKKDKKGKNPQVEEGVIHYNVTRRCDLNRIYQIKKILEKENLELFEQSCFGHLLKIHSNDLIFQGQVFAQLLLHVDMDASNKERQLVFNIANSQLRFSAKDFALITGLRLGTSEATTTTTSEFSSIHKNVLGGKPRTTMKEFEEAFLRVSREHKGKGELTLKLSFLYFLFGILLPKQPLDGIEAQHLHLVEDLEKFNSFSWGRVSYEFLVSSVLSVRSNMDSLKSGKKARSKDPRLDMHGFIYALQIWVYEVMPSLAEHCAHNSKNSLTQPRIFCWTTLNKRIRFENLKKFFAPGDGVHLVVDGIEGEVEELSPQPKKAKVVSKKDHKCSTFGANEDVIIMIAEDDDVVASDDDSCSTAFMDNYVASLHK